MVQGALKACELAVLSACESAAGGLGLEIDEHAGLPAALQLAGAGTVVSTLWPVSDTLTALQVDLLYEALAAQSGVVDVAAAVRDLGERVRSLTLDEALARLGALRALTTDPLARVVIEAYANRLPERGERPFAHPYDWATFRVTGTGRARLGVSDVRAVA